MEEIQPAPPALPSPRYLPAGQDWFGEQHGLTMSQIDLKVAPHDSQDVLMLENTFLGKGGPPRHLHFAQDEWFYVVEGEFAFEVGAESFRLQPGDSLLAPRQTPHVWAHIGSQRGKILIGFMPAGQMEDFFRHYMQGNVMPPKDPEIWRAHGMQLLGPPLAVG